MKFRLILFAALLSLGVQAQNLVDNGSFENTGDCPFADTSATNYGDFLEPWTFFGNKPDYYHPCGFAGSDSATNNTLAFDGQGYVGLDVYGETAPGSGRFRRDYIHGELKEPMDSGKFYRVSFYVMPLNNDATGYSYGVSNLGLLITDTVVDTVPSNFLIQAKPQVVETDVVDQTNHWTSICGIYKAKGGEQFVTIGNFKNDIQTQVTPLENATAPRYGRVMVDFVEVVENDFPQLGPDTILCAEDRIDLIISGPDISVQWQDESTNKLFVVTKPGTYSARISNGFCTYVDSIVIDGVFCNRCEIYAPTAFTPNGDGLNEEFTVIPNCDEEGALLDYNIRIFDRWGRKVFESESPEISWTGRDADHQGIYTYTVEYSYKNELEVKTGVKRGFVNVIK